ncbi:hypothetical protein OIU84_023592 [Salix udensis]|uniref:Uncharacterized protein n=1 Tax=Salix udensis TaxID=889485 RepID=A0AAD6PH46_9ROSI|nr:hypothetical protein OIU84_023592 [Salix udensis]
MALWSILHSNENVVVALKRSSRLLSADLNVYQPNIDLLRKEGVPVDMVAKLIILNAGTILSKRDRMVATINAIKNLGLEPDNKNVCTRSYREVTNDRNNLE